jgi:hypothetical protein
MKSSFLVSVSELQTALAKPQLFLECNAQIEKELLSVVFNYG